MVQKTLLPPPQPIKIRILLNTPEPVSEVSIPHLAQQKVQKEIQKLQPQPKQPPLVPSIKTPVSVPTKLAPPTVQASTTIVTPAPTKSAEPVNVQKAPPPKVEENYEEENLGRIRSILAQRLKYPKNALRLKQQGECVATFTLEPNRDINQIIITQSSGFELLDNAAIELIQTSASEFPKPKKSIRISVPISYKIR